MLDPTGVSILAYFALALQFCLGIVFAISATPKLYRPLAFVQSVVKYEVLPAKVAQAFGLVLIPAEGFLAFSFLTGFGTDIALWLAIVLLGAFLFAVGINLKRGRKVSCGCFGNADEQISPRTLMRLVLLVAAVLLLMALRSTGTVLSLPGFDSIWLGDASTIAFLLSEVLLGVSVLLLAAWLLSLPELFVLFHHPRGRGMVTREHTDAGRRGVA
ncbi:MAG: hypothetical protein HZB53_09850 [Chloroflexi bacterium]|nr:hypothetical protein [Chloroflexota bacterium]